MPKPVSSSAVTTTWSVISLMVLLSRMPLNTSNVSYDLTLNHMNHKVWKEEEEEEER